MKIPNYLDSPPRTRTLLLPVAVGVATSLLLFAAATPILASDKPAYEGNGLTQRTDNCVTSECHGEYQELRHVHGPVALGLCLSCHEIMEDSTPYESGEDHWFDVVETDGRLCQNCHESIAEESVVHYPIRRNKCIACHDPHGSDYPGMMRHEKMADNCYECHEPVLDDDPHIHAPVRVGACTVCHDPHGSANPFQTVAEGSNLCLRCHSGIADTIARSRHIHRPVMENCAVCHQPHDALHGPLLKEAVPKLCLDCHGEMAEHIQNAALPHGALDGERSCLKCHDPHASNFSRQLRDKPSELCLSCHNKEMMGSDHVLRDMRSFLEVNPDHHGPIRNGDCSACHNPHGSEIPALLYKEYPKTFYSSFDLEAYSLCFSCHEHSLVQDPETETLTGFRNGNVNLHFVHVNRENKGRTCRACHDVHASQHPKHIANSVPFGNWSMPIQFEKTPQGGSCSPGCHDTQSYDRNAVIVPREESDAE